MARKYLGLSLGVTGVAVALMAGLLHSTKDLSFAKTRPPLVATLDPRGPYVLAMTEAAARQYGEAIAEARMLHPSASEVVFSVRDLQPVEALFVNQQPRYAMVFILPEELDVNFAWKWLRLITKVDDDPFVDVRTGFITGKDPDTAARFVARIRSAVEKKPPLPSLAIDNLGPNMMAPGGAFFQTRGNFMIPVLEERVGLSTISHGTNGFGSEHLDSLDNACLIHFGGHGYPDRVVDGMTGAQVRQLRLAPCVVFNGACYTGVTGRWYEMRDKIMVHDVVPENSFCLAMLANNVLGYFAALSPDHGIPVYQEMEFLATEGASLGDIIKHTWDGIVLADGGNLPALHAFRDGMGRPKWTPADYMLKGTASRVLFGDPALMLTTGFAAPAFAVQLRPETSDTLRLIAVLKNTRLQATFTDTYFSDLSSVPNLFNDRALITCKLPDGWETVRQVEVLQVTARGASIKARLQGFGVEQDGLTRLLHIQVDLPTTGYMQSQFRAVGARVELKLSRGSGQK